MIYIVLLKMQKYVFFLNYHIYFYYVSIFLYFCSPKK